MARRTYSETIDDIVGKFIDIMLYCVTLCYIVL